MEDIDEDDEMKRLWASQPELWPKRCIWASKAESFSVAEAMLEATSARCKLIACVGLDSMLVRQDWLSNFASNILAMKGRIPCHPGIVIIIRVCLKESRNAMPNAIASLDSQRRMTHVNKVPIEPCLCRHGTSKPPANVYLVFKKSRPATYTLGSW